MSDGAAIIVEYTNWRGETARRTIKPLRLWWGNTEYHPEDQWVLTAYDCEKKVERDFAWQDMTPVRTPATSAAPSPALAVLAMRERAAEICFVPEQAHIAWDMKNGNFPKRSARHEYIAAEIRALPTTFTDAELLAAARLLPKVQALVDLTPEIIAALRSDDLNVSLVKDVIAALAPFTKGAS